MKTSNIAGILAVWNALVALLHCLVMRQVFLLNEGTGLFIRPRARFLVQVALAPTSTIGVLLAVTSRFLGLAWLLGLASLHALIALGLAHVVRAAVITYLCIAVFDGLLLVTRWTMSFLRINEEGRIVRGTFIVTLVAYCASIYFALRLLRA